MNFTAAAPGGVHLALLNGKIWTEDPTCPEAEAVAISGSRISAVGYSQEIRKLAGAQTVVVDLSGKRVVPGFNDAHVHFYTGGASLTSVQLGDVRSRTEFAARVGAFARSRPAGEWILNGSWDPEKWNPPQLPTHEWIDDVTPHHPVFVNRSDAHTLLANSVAMKLAGVTRNTPNIPGGLIVRDANGYPTGIFKDAANELIERLIPAPSEEQITSAVLAAQQHAIENGVTSVQDMGVVGRSGLQTTLDVIDIYRKLRKRGALRLRIAAHVPLREWKRITSTECDGIDDHLTLKALKAFSDGSLGSSTAWFFDDYTDAPGNAGLQSDELLEPERMFRDMTEADHAGLQIAIHAIGDRANNTILNFYERLQRQNGPRNRRPRIEHAQHLLASDIPRFGELGVIASAQPYHCIDDGRWAEKRIGRDRTGRAFPFRSLLDGGATLAFGSDWWVAPISPLLGIHAAVTRSTLDGHHPSGWAPEQKITVREALHAYTVASAYAEFEENNKGSIQPGKFADLAVLSGDILTMDPSEIQNVTVDMTIVDGKIAFDRGKHGE